MTLEQLLALIGAKEVDLYVARKRIAELEAQIVQLTTVGVAPDEPKQV